VATNEELTALIRRQMTIARTGPMAGAIDNPAVRARYEKARDENAALARATDLAIQAQATVHQRASDHVLNAVEHLVANTRTGDPEVDAIMQGFLEGQAVILSSDVTRRLLDMGEAQGAIVNRILKEEEQKKGRLPWQK
jgi:hypothetical protein